MRIRPLCLAVLLVLPIVVVGAKKDAQKNPPNAKPPNTSEVARLIVEGTNAFREQEGRRHVRRNSELDAAALYFAGFMAEHNKLSHEADGRRPADRAKQYGYDYCIVLENIAYEYDSRGFAVSVLAHKFVEGWEKSPGHRKNMLDANVTQIGVAVARGEKANQYYAVQMFGRPKSDSMEFSIFNGADAEISYSLNAKTFSLPPRYTQTHQQCGPVKLEINGSPAVTVNNGDRYAVVGARSGKLQLRKD